LWKERKEEIQEGGLIQGRMEVGQMVRLRIVQLFESNRDGCGGSGEGWWRAGAEEYRERRTKRKDRVDDEEKTTHHA